MLPLIVIRPEPGNAGTAAAARGMGLQVIPEPLFELQARAWDAPPVDQFDALLVGSANAFRLGGSGLGGLRSLPVHAVGKTTARAATAKGFVVAAMGTGGLQAVLDRVPSGTRLLRLAGEDRVRLVPPEGVSLIERVVYASAPRPVPAGLAAALARPAVIALHSAEAAIHLAAECARLGIDRSRLALVTMGPRVSAAAGDGWRMVIAAESPAELPLLDKARDLCQTLTEN